MTETEFIVHCLKKWHKTSGHDLGKHRRIS